MVFKALGYPVSLITKSHMSKSNPRIGIEGTLHSTLQTTLFKITSLALSLGPATTPSRMIEIPSSIHFRLSRDHHMLSTHVYEVPMCSLVTGLQLTFVGQASQCMEVSSLLQPQEYRQKY